MKSKAKKNIVKLIQERICDLELEMTILNDGIMMGLIGWEEYEEKRKILAKARTGLELELKLLTENESGENN